MAEASLDSWADGRIFGDVIASPHFILRLELVLLGSWDSDWNGNRVYWRCQKTENKQRNAV